MADNNLPPELNLEQILATLAALPQTTTPPVPPQQQPQVAPPYPAPQETHSNPYPPQPVHSHPPDPRLTAHPPSTRPQPTPTPKPTHKLPTDPTTITTWKHALRHVTHLATHSPTFIPTIRKLLADQSRNLSDWESGRQRLITEQAAKRATEEEHLALLSLPGIAQTIQPLRTDEVEAEELRVYDGKVWRACERMVRVQGESLRAEGVPFWGVREGLLRAEGDGGEEADRCGKVTRGEVMVLRRRMLEYLGELYGD